MAFGAEFEGLIRWPGEAGVVLYNVGTVSQSGCSSAVRKVDQRVEKLLATAAWKP